MKKLLLFLTMMCVFPILGHSQVLSTTKADKDAVPAFQAGNDTHAQGVNSDGFSSMTVSREGKTIKKTKKSKFSSGKAEERPRINYVVNDEEVGPGAECLIAHTHSELQPAGLYHFTLCDPTIETSYENYLPTGMWYGAAEYVNGFIYILTWEGWQGQSALFLQVDPITSDYEIISTISYNYTSDISYNPTDGVMYCNNQGDMYSIDIITGELTSLFNISGQMFGMTIDNTGRCFALGRNPQGISEIDLSTGNIISTLPLPEGEYMFIYGSRHLMACNRETNKIYWLGMPDGEDMLENYLYEVDFDGGEYTLLRQFSTYCTSCFAIMSDYNPDRPSVPTELSLTPDPAQGLTCELSWTNPTLTVGGDGLESITEMVIKRNGAVIAEIEDATPGETMTYIDVVPESWRYSYSVYAVSDEGNGSSVGASVVIGNVCEYTIEMHDEFGDGWNSAELIFTKEDGTLIQGFTCSGESQTTTVWIPEGVINMKWASGFYDEECAFTVYYPWDEVMYEVETGDEPSSGVLFSWTNTCQTPFEYVTVSGTVTSSYTGNPVSNANVQFDGGTLGIMTAVTDENGEYSIELAQNKTFDITITATGYNKYTESYVTPATEVVTKDIVISQPDIAIEPDAVVVLAYSMQVATQELVISNAGTGELTYHAKCYVDDGEKEDNTECWACHNTRMFKFNLNDPSNETLTDFEAPYFLNSMCFMDWKYYFALDEGGLYAGIFGTFDPETGSFEIISTQRYFSTIAYNPVDDMLYGAHLGYTQSLCIYTIDAVTGEQTPVVIIDDFDIFVMSIEFDNYGNCYMINAEADCIVKVDLALGTWTPVIEAGFNVNYGQDLDCDRWTNTLYWAAFNATDFQAQLYILNVDEGTMSFVGSFMDQTSGFAIPTIVNTGGWLSVEPKDGVVEANGEKTLTVSMDGWHAEEGTFTGRIEMTNNTINSVVNIPVTFTIIPPDCDAPQNLAIEIVDYNNIALTWDSPAEGNPIAYRVYYGDDHEPWATTEENYFIDEGLEPGEYCYKVRAIYEDGCMSASPDEVCGTTEQPYRLVEGHVYSTIDGSDIAGAIITFTGITPFGARTAVAISDEEGMYSVDVFDGTYSVTAVADGFNVYTVNEYTIEPFGPYTLDFPMEQPAVSLSDYEVTITTGYMNQGIHTMTVTNSGTGELTWSVNIETYDKAPKSIVSAAHVALGGQNLYNFTLIDPEYAVAAGFGGSEFMNTAVYVDGVTYFATSTSGQFGTIDYENGSVEVIKTGNASGGITYNPADGQLYGIMLGAGTTVYTINPETGAETAVISAANSNFVLGCAMNADGRMFIIDAEIDGISEMNLSTGEFTTVWAGGWAVNYGQDIEFDFEDNLLYWAAFNATAFEAQLWQINVDEGTALQIGTFADQASCFSIETKSYSWLKSNPKSGVVPAGESGTFDLVADGWYAEFGTFHADVTFNNNSLTPAIVVPVTFIINPPDCAPVQNLAGSVEDFNDFYITWNAPAENPEDVIAYGIYHGDDKVPFAQVDPSEFEIVIEDNAPGTYYFRVRAIYADGCVSMSDALLELTAVEAFGTVYGVVTDSFNGQAIVGATVKFGGAFQAVTDENGEFSMDVTQGYYTVRVSADSYKTYVEENVYVDVYENPMGFELTSLYAPVQNLAAVEENGDVILTWDAPATDDKAVKRGNDHPFIAETSTANATLTAAPVSTAEAYNVNPSNAEDAMALAAHNMQLGYFTLNAPANWTSYGISGSEFMNTAAYYDGMYYFATSTSGQFGTIDPQTGAVNVIKSGNASGGIGYNPVDDALYGIVLGSNSVIYTIDPATGTETFVANINAANFLLGFTFDAEGRMFVIDAEVDGISEIDPATGNLIGSMVAGFTVNYGQDMDVDLELNETYWFAYNATANAAQLYKFNFDEGTMELIGTGSTQTSCFAIVSEAVSTEITGYMVERDGEEIATVGPATLTYVDQDVDFGDHTYCVTAIYEDIFSAPVCVTVEMGILGDANGDGVVNVGDVSAIVAYIMFQNPQPFYFKNSDVNGDGVINVGDVSGTILIIFSGKSTCETGEVEYQIETGVLYMYNTSPVSALQIALSESSDVEIKGFVVNQGMTPDGYMVVAYNFDGTVFEAGVHALCQVNDAEVNYFIASNACGDVMDGRDGAFLGINDNTMAPAYPNPFSTSVTISNNANAEFVVTSMTGQVVYRAATSSNFVWTPENVNSGVYFINVYVDGVKTQTNKIVYKK